MFLYSVTVATNTPSSLNLADLHLSVYIKEEDRLRFGQNSWLVYTPNWPNWIRNAITPALQTDDRLLITTVAQPFDGVFDSCVVRWINSRLAPYPFESFKTTPAPETTVQH